MGKGKEATWSAAIVLVTYGNQKEEICFLLKSTNPLVRSSDDLLADVSGTYLFLINVVGGPPLS
jgi:hypothetical protein